MRLGRRNRPARRARRTRSANRRSDYRAVEVVPGETACAAVHRLEQRRVLLGFIHLFPLPLPECDAETCQCHYRQHADRRSEDRRLPFGSRAAGDSERRARSDRRAGWHSLLADGREEDA